MSLETVIQENTAALRELIAKLGAGAAIQTAATTVVVTNQGAAATKPAVEAKVEEKKPAATPAVEETKAAADTPAAESPSDAALDYNKDVKPLLVKLSTAKGRDALVGLLSTFGVTKGDQLPADQLAAVVAEVNKQLAA